MKKNIILFLLSTLIHSCQNKTESDNTNSSNNESSEVSFTCESNIDVKSHNEGQFIGEFSHIEQGMWDQLIFLDKEKKNIWINYWGRDLNLKKNDGSNYFIESKNLQLLDSVYNFPEKFKGRLLRVGWSKFTIEGDEETQPSNSDPILTHLNYPNVKFDDVKNSTNNVINENTNNSSNLTDKEKQYNELIKTLEKYESNGFSRNPKSFLITLLLAFDYPDKLSITGSKKDGKYEGPIVVRELSSGILKVESGILKGLYGMDNFTYEFTLNQGIIDGRVKVFRNYYYYPKNQVVENRKTIFFDAVIRDGAFDGQVIEYWAGGRSINGNNIFLQRGNFSKGKLNGIKESTKIDSDDQKYFWIYLVEYYDKGQLLDKVEYSTFNVLKDRGNGKILKELNYSPEDLNK